MIEKKIAEISHKYKFLTEFSFSKNFRVDGSCDVGVRIVIRQHPSPESNFLELTAFSVIEINIGNLIKSVCVILKIDDISGYMVEGGKFKISDVENNQFSLVCDDFYFREG